MTIERTEKGLLAARAAPRCLAKTRRGSPCQRPALRGKKRCKLHGGASTGAPKGNQNAFKHGKDFISARALIRVQSGLSTSQIPREMIEAKLAILQVKRKVRLMKLDTPAVL